MDLIIYPNSSSKTYMKIASAVRKPFAVNSLNIPAEVWQTL